MNLINVIIIIAALLSASMFMIAYSFTKWEESSEGINIMLLPVTFIFMGISSLGRRFDLMSQVSADTVSILAWLLVAILMIQRSNQLIKAQKGKPQPPKEKK